MYVSLYLKQTLYAATFRFIITYKVIYNIINNYNRIYQENKVKRVLISLIIQ